MFTSQNTMQRVHIQNPLHFQNLGLSEMYLCLHLFVLMISTRSEHSRFRPASEMTSDWRNNFRPGLM